MIEPAANQDQERAPGPDPYFMPAGSGSRHLIFPGVEIRTAAGTNLMISVVHLEPGSVVSEHSHPHEQMGILLEGKLEFTVGGVTRVLGPGDMWRIPGGVVHGVRTLAQPAVAIDVFHPIRADYL
jgi:quercetin dioxygenase-like cupin family protein